MPGSVAQFPQTPSGGDGIPPADLYKIAVEEYRFQAQFNWSRTQYLLAFNAAVLAAALALIETTGDVAALVFVVGTIAAVLSGLVVHQQHDYYRAARDHVRRIEERHQVAVEDRLDTTTVLGGRTRFLSVNQVVYILLALIAWADTAGIIFALEAG